jgi:hypothetical protein
MVDRKFLMRHGNKIKQFSYENFLRIFSNPEFIVVLEKSKIHIRIEHLYELKNMNIGMDVVSLHH